MDIHTLEVVLTKVEQVSLADSVNKNKWEEEVDRQYNNNKVNFSVSLHYLERSEGGRRKERLIAGFDIYRGRIDC